jgi:lipopolysaccharide export LptBFGC system permease protein LptF
MADLDIPGAVFLFTLVWVIAFVGIRVLSDIASLTAIRPDSPFYQQHQLLSSVFGEFFPMVLPTGIAIVIAALLLLNSR